MLNYQEIMRFYTRGHRRIWYLLFRSKFKRFGKQSYIAFPRSIQNPEFIEIGENVSIYNNARLITLKRVNNNPSLIIGDNTVIYYDTTISALRKVSIGKNVLIAERVYISDNLHGYEDITIPIMNQMIIFKNEVRIGDDSWIGENVSIIGARIGKHCVIGANSVVTKDMPDYCVAAGIPAKVIKRYNFKTNEWRVVDRNGQFKKME